ncbi:IS110 family transposase [Leifsonia sp. TF02-11]|uniref:IS110 family transposase n=1 Tax=Leifsonia sp. TF02-11 TaxID=2815212 RepID=UPI001AA0E90F|nr:IS110 family transposase [Leifsonia sp. TF02-11]MBO1739656.1 IS110 family transposase [Leifsonia sp. TF02-11]
MPQLWAGIDAGKTHHHCVVIDEDGKRHISRRFANTEADILTLLGDVAEAADGGQLLWATDLNHGGAGLMKSVLADHGQTLCYIPGRVVAHASHAYRGEAKTDAKDAAIIADQARVRRDLEVLRLPDDITAELKILSNRRADLVQDRTRIINRLRALLLHYFPGLEGAFDYAATKGPLILLTRYQTAAAIRASGQVRMTGWLRKQGVRLPAQLAAKALEAANAQLTVVHGEAAAAALVAKIAADLLHLREELLQLDGQIEARLAEHPFSQQLLSIPGFGKRLVADFLASTGTDLTMFGTSARFASFAGLAPAPRDSGKINGNHHRPRRFDRRLMNACFLSAFIASTNCPVSAAYYDRKRREGKTHKQAIISLARRRMNVIWAMLRDGTIFDNGHPQLSLTT